jgi:hypothetical protein
MNHLYERWRSFFSAGHIGYRRDFLRGLLAIIGIGIAGPALSAGEPDKSGIVTSGTELRTKVIQGQPAIDPLDTMVLLARSDDNNDRAMTHEVLSLIHEEKGKNSYPWTIYSHLTSNHVQGDACVLCSRLTKNGRGWSAGLHSEVYTHAPMVALGVNVEMNNLYTGPEPTVVVGLNIQAHGKRTSQYGVQVQDVDNHFEKAIGLNGSGDTGLDVHGKYDVGVHAHDNSIRLNEGACIELDGQGKIRLRYKSGRIEFMNGDHCFGHLDVNGEDHAL